MAHPESINVIALSLRSARTRVLGMVLEIMGAVCLIPGGHKRILQGMHAID
jgi:dishevelled associated activator of morphogenesis